MNDDTEMKKKQERHSSGICDLSPRVINEVAQAASEGHEKYGWFSFRKESIRASTHINAASRHIGAYIDGEEFDPETGIHHLSKAIAGLMVLRDAQMSGTAIDDRPPSIYKAEEDDSVEQAPPRKLSLEKKIRRNAELVKNEAMRRINSKTKA